MNRNRYIGIAEETEFGSDTILEPKVYLDIASTSLDAASSTNLYYTGGLGRGTRHVAQGSYLVDGDIQYAADLHTFGYFMKWGLGEYKFTDNLEQLKKHEFYRTNSTTLKTFQAQVGKDAFEHIFVGCGINNITLETSNEFLNATIGVISKKDILGGAPKQVASNMLPHNFPIAYHQITAKIGGIDESAKIKSLSLSIENGLNGEDGMGLGSRYTNRLITGESSISLSIEMQFENNSRIADLQSGLEFPVEITIMDRDAISSATILLPRCVYEVVNQQPSGRDEIVQSVECKALVGSIQLNDLTTIENDILVTINNTELEY